MIRWSTQILALCLIAVVFFMLGKKYEYDQSWHEGATPSAVAGYDSRKDLRGWNMMDFEIARAFIKEVGDGMTILMNKDGLSSSSGYAYAVDSNKKTPVIVMSVSCGNSKKEFTQALPLQKMLSHIDESKPHYDFDEYIHLAIGTYAKDFVARAKQYLLTCRT